LAHFLLERGVRADDLVGIAMQRSIDLIMSLLAVWKAGAAYLPLDSTHPPDRLQFMLDDAKPRIVLTRRTDCEQVWPRCRRYASIRTRSRTETRDDADPQPHGRQDRGTSVGGAHAAYVIYTSGSTGRPKAVCGRTAPW